MYTPPSFRIDDPILIRKFVEENSFGILLSSIDGTSIQDTHIPFILSEDGKYLCGHIARANNHWRDWKENDKLKVIFHGPHCYISPSFYRSGFNVPTWNYTAVSIGGEIEIIESIDEQKEFIHPLLGRHESSLNNPWSLDEKDEEMMKLFSAIVFFKIFIINTEAKFKLNQNKAKEDQKKVIDHLFNSTSSFDHEVARMMKAGLVEEGAPCNPDKPCF